MLPNIIEGHSQHSLYYYQCGSLPCQVFFIHGLLGSGRLWQTFLKMMLHDKGMSSCALDLRGHGRSPKFDRLSPFQTMVADVIQFILDIGKPPVYLIGHSLGGKVVMRLAAQAPELIKKVMIVDIGLDPIPPNIPNAISWLQAIPTPVASFEEARKQLQQFTTDQRLCDFLLTNLSAKENEQGLHWRVDLEGLQELVEELKYLSFYEEWRQIEAPITLVRGGNSDHLILEHAEEMIRQKRDNQVQHVILPRSGHWCHADEPQKFRAALEEFVSN